MADVKEKSRVDELREEYFAAQLTPQQKAEARAAVIAKIDAAAAAGVYERAAELVGTIQWSMTWQELRGKE